MSDSKSPERKRRTIRVDALTRVEGEGALHLVMCGDRVEEVRLEIYEPPRFFESLLRGRGFAEVPDITARICGICPVAYQSASCYALEKAFGCFDEVVAAPGVQDLRDLIYCGEWIESHVLHMFLLHLPDFLGQESAFALAQDHGPLIKRALRLKKLGNRLLALLGGRAVHPVGMCVGGFHDAPTPAAVADLLPEVAACRDEMCDLTLQLTKLVTFPDLERDYEFVSLCPENGYPLNLGRIRSNRGLDVSQEEFGEVIEERQVPHSTALHSVLKERGAYLVGPLARLNLNAEGLHPVAAELLPAVCDAVGKTLPWRNSYLSLPARALETVHALALAADLLAAYTEPPRTRVPIVPRAGDGAHGTEAPRGICWHHYTTAEDGAITSARIVPPTAQNQPTIEQDLLEVARLVTALPDAEAAQRCEHVIRNFDPCISCAAHFLTFSRTWIDPESTARPGDEASS
ncbi:MAG: nickel-dependent hydrogenase large subunit [bacterium]